MLDALFHDPESDQAAELIEGIRKTSYFADHVFWGYVEELWGEVSEISVSAPEIFEAHRETVIDLSIKMNDLSHRLRRIDAFRYVKGSVELPASWINETTGERSETTTRMFTPDKLTSMKGNGVVVVRSDTGREQVCLELVAKRVRDTDTGSFREVVWVPASLILRVALNKHPRAFDQLIGDMARDVATARRLHRTIVKDGGVGFACFETAEELLEPVGEKKAEIIQTDTAKYTIGLFG